MWTAYWEGLITPRYTLTKQSGLYYFLSSESRYWCLEVQMHSIFCLVRSYAPNWTANTTLACHRSVICSSKVHATMCRRNLLVIAPGRVRVRHLWKMFHKIGQVSNLNSIAVTVETIQCKYRNRVLLPGSPCYCMSPIPPLYGPLTRIFPLRSPSAQTPRTAMIVKNEKTRLPLKTKL
jgi:hypothetical protein